MKLSYDFKKDWEENKDIILACWAVTATLLLFLFMIFPPPPEIRTETRTFIVCIAPISCSTRTSEISVADPTHIDGPDLDDKIWFCSPAGNGRENCSTEGADNVDR